MKTFIRELCIAISLLAMSICNSQFSPAFAQTTVFPIATNASVVEISGGIAASKTNYLVAFLSGTNVCSQIVTTNGTDGLMVTNGHSRFNGGGSFPFVTFGTNYLEVWYDTINSNGYAQIISRSGSAPSSPISLNYEPKAAASDGTNFLIVLEDTIGNYYGQFISGGGALTGSVFLINNQQEDNSGNAPAAAVYGATSYFVLMQANFNGSMGNSNFATGVFVSPNGSVTGPFQIAQESSEDHQLLSAAFDGTNFLAVWNWDPPPETGQSVTNWQVRGRLVSQTGTFPGNEITLANQGNPSFPTAAFNGTNYLLCWSEGLIVSNSPNINFQFVDRSANAIGPSFTVFSAQGTNSPALPINGLIYDGKRFVAAVTLADVAVTNLNIDGILGGRVFGAFIFTNAPTPFVISAFSYASVNTFQMAVNGPADLTYTVQMSTNLLSTNWISLLVTNPPANLFRFTDPNATNKQRFYRVLEKQ